MKAVLEPVLTAVIDALTAAGLDAERQYPAARLGRLTAPKIFAGVQSSTLKGSGYGEYLGIRALDGAEVYGLRLELCLALDIYAPLGAEQDCLQTFEAISSALAGLPSGIRPTVLVCGETVPGPEAGLLQCRAQLHCSAALLCRADEDSGQFHDFELKGVLTHADQ